MMDKNSQPRPSTRWSEGEEDTWGPYWDQLFGPEMVTSWIDWKRGSTGVNIARNYWENREYLRRAYESVYGTDPEQWPAQHPGVVVGERPLCLRCHYFGAEKAPLDALDRARRHENSGGEICEGVVRPAGTDWHKPQQ